MNPETISMITIGVYVSLTLLKLPAAVLSGSVGLFNDSIDTLVDAIFSILILAGMHMKRERTISIGFLMLTIATGCFMLYDAMVCFINPIDLRVNLLTFIPSIITMIVCSMLWALQHRVASYHGSVALIAQSIDSRNHVIAGVGVMIGMTGSLLQFSFLDSIIGFAVALLIIQSAIELSIKFKSPSWNS